MRELGQMFVEGALRRLLRARVQVNDPGSFPHRFDHGLLRVLAPGEEVRAYTAAAHLPGGLPEIDVHAPGVFQA